MNMLDLFTQRTALDYRGVEGLIAGRYVRGTVNLFIRHLDNSCNLAAKEIANLDDTVLDRMHRVLRLARKTRLASADVDRLAAASKLGAVDLGDAALRALADMTAVAADLRVGVSRLITWLGRRAVYETVPLRIRRQVVDQFEQLLGRAWSLE